MISALQRAPELQKYELLEELGHGGMATVFRAKDRRLGRDVAVKLIHPHLRESREVAARFISEARAVAKLRHPNIVDVYDISDADESERYLVVELIRGITLRQLLRDQGRLPVEVAVAIALQVGAALEHAHAEGVIHRDIKPENVLIELPSQDAQGEAKCARIKLTDFGIAKLLDVQGITSTGQVLGSPAHMAPEQIEGADVDARADVFGLGVLLYECLTGQLPFDGKNPAQVLRAVLEGTFVSPEKAVPQIGSGYARIVNQALARDVEKRFANMSAFISALTEELDKVELAVGATEINNYLLAPKQYADNYKDKIVPRLVRAGERARTAGQVAQAYAYYNRALSYEPNNREVMSKVTGLTLRRRIKLALRWAALSVAVLLVGFAAMRQVETAKSKRREPAVAITERAPTETRQAAPAVDPEILPKANPPADEVPRSTPVRSGTRPAPKKVAPRIVEVRITGAMGGSLKIDGAPRDWFGVQHSLEPGEHVFEFVPPNDTCCTPQVQRVLIKEGEGAQLVIGKLAFRDAVLRVSGKSAAEMTCPTLFSGSLTVPGERVIPMNTASVSGMCTLVEKGAEGEPPERRTLTLRAGQTTTFP